MIALLLGFFCLAAGFGRGLEGLKAKTRRSIGGRVHAH